MNNLSSVDKFVKESLRNKWIIVFAFSLLLFTDVRILFRVFFQNEIIAVFAALCLLVFLILLDIKLLLLAKIRNVRIFILFFIFFCFAILKQISAGLSFGDIIQYLPLIVYGSFIYIMTRYTETCELLLKGLVFVMILHASSLLPISFIRSGLEAQTAYGLDDFDILVGRRRETGFTSSAGFLSLYSSISFAIGLTLFYYTRKKEWLVLILVSVVCGIATVNRSFLLVVAVYFLFCPLILKGLGKNIVVLFLLLGGLIGCIYFVANYTNYVAVLVERFSIERLFDPNNDRINGETGIVDLAKSIAYSPITGSLQINPSEYMGPTVFNGSIYIRPHNGIVGILASYGLIFGGIYIYIVFFSLKQLIAKSFTPTVTPLDKAMLAGSMAMNIVCLVESLYELPIVFLCVFYGCNITKQHRNKHKIHNQT